MPPSRPDQRELLTSLLRDVSRSFYLTMRMLPGRIRPQVSLAYLLARTTDTIADTDAVPVDQRLAMLEQLRERILGSTRAPLDLSACTVPSAPDPSIQPKPRQPARHSRAEGVLLLRVEDALAVLDTFSSEDQQRIREVLNTITSGQQLDLQRFGRANVDQVVALQRDDELEDYTYRVAGCVGEFWTKMCRAHLFPKDSLDDAALIENGVRFGKGLQLVNILRDIPADLRNGRCYLPLDRLEKTGLQPEELFRLENEPRLRPLYNEYLDYAHEHLAAGWTYTNTLQRGQIRLRLACAWPLLIGAATLKKLRTANVLDSTRRVKISRDEVRQILTRSILSYPFPSRWRALFD